MQTIQSPVVELAFNYVGLLKSYLKSALYNYMEFPTNDNWNEIYSMMVTPKHTVWQAVLELDSTFPARIPVSAKDPDNLQWERIPSVVLVNMAIAKVVMENHYELRLN